MRTVSPARVLLAVAVAALSTALLAAPATAGPGDPPSLFPSGPAIVRVGPGMTAPKPVQVEIRNDGDLAAGVVVTVDATDVPEAFDIDLPGTDQGCTTVGDVARCELAELGFGEAHTYTFGVAAAGTTAAEGAVRVSSTAGNAPQENSTTIGLALVAAGVDLALAPVVPTPPGYWSLDPGDSVDVPVQVRNDGGAAATGVVLRIGTHAEDASTDMIQLVAPYDNCTVDPDLHDLTCAFDTTVGPGETFAIDPATPVRAKVNDAAPGNNSYAATVAVSAAAEVPAAKSAGRVARLVPVSTLVADLNGYDNSQVLIITVEGLRAAEGVAVGATVTGDIGDSRTVAVGFRNDGPAAVAAREGNGGGARVLLPAGLKVTGICDGCRPMRGAEVLPPDDLRGLEYACPAGGFILPGATEWCRFDVEIVARPGQAGWIRINSGQQDRNPANDVAPILLVVPGGGTGGGEEGLPITGLPAGPTAGAGTILVGLGLAALILTRRRGATGLNSGRGREAGRSRRRGA
ncbi:hypothetical protein ACIA5D_16770 [Actinoplanes sp. NPDC051513]|uniref:hypothetical protein n=1 Tax=Actinoplanes sp. NPDC051513 TaxID=3363908 RepID=UPI0037AE42BF